MVRERALHHRYLFAAQRSGGLWAWVGESLLDRDASVLQQAASLKRYGTRKVAVQPASIHIA